MGTHGRRGLGYSVLGSVAAEVVRRAPCPVLTIRERQQAKPLGEDGRILVPVDFSGHSIKALQYARDIALKYNSRLDILHVVCETCYPKVYGVAKGIDKVIKEKAHAELQKICKEEIGPEVKFFIHTISGNAPFEILSFAEKNQNKLIVIPTHGCTGLKHFFFGSVAEKVVRRAPCPVFTIKAFGKSLI
jgi:nucleotide-binding universal stress UspA family protein